MVHQHLDGVEQRQLSAGGEDGLVRSIVGPEIAGVPLHNRFSEFRNARDHRIAREIAFDGRDGGIFYVARGRKMRFPGAKID